LTLWKKRKHQLGDRFENLLNEEMSIFEGKVGIDKIKELEQQRMNEFIEREKDKREKSRSEEEYNKYLSQKSRTKELEKRR